MRNELVTTTASQPVTIQDIDSLSGAVRDRWAVYISDRSAKTVKTYTTNIMRFVDFCNDNGFFKPSRETIVAYKVYLEARYKSASTRQAYMNAVRAFFKWAAGQGYWDNIYTDIKPVRVSDEHKDGYLTTEQAAKVLDTIDRSTLTGERDYALLCLLFSTGIRQIEAIRANVGDIKTVGGQKVLDIQRKGHEDKDNAVPLAPQAYKALAEYIAARPQASADSPLFVGHSHSNITETRLVVSNMSRMIRRRLDEAGFTRAEYKVSGHSTRHTAAMICLELTGNDVLAVKRLLGHRNINTSMKYLEEKKRTEAHTEQDIANAIFSVA